MPRPVTEGNEGRFTYPLTKKAGDEFRPTGLNSKVWNDNSLLVLQNPFSGAIRDRNDRHSGLGCLNTRYGMQPHDVLVRVKECQSEIVKLDYLAGELRSAKMIPRKATEYKVKYCNLWQASDQTWIPDATWNRTRANVKKHADLFADLGKMPCYLSLDLSTIWDYTALTSYFFSKEADRFWVRHKFYIPEAQIDRKAHEENPSIRKWIEDGLIIATPGECIDYSYLYADIDAAMKAHRVLGIVYDPAKAKEFETTYATRAELVTFRQVALNMSPAAKAWEKAIVDGKICDSNPVMRWMLSNAINKSNPNSGSYFITKNPTATARRRIDGVITSIMAHWSLSNWVLEDSKPKPKLFDLSKITY